MEEKDVFPIIKTERDSLIDRGWTHGGDQPGEGFRRDWANLADWYYVPSAGAPTKVATDEAHKRDFLGDLQYIRNKAAYARMEENGMQIMDVLNDCREYFDNRADAEYFSDSARPVANEEMDRLSDINRLLATLEGKAND